MTEVSNVLLIEHNEFGEFVDFIKYAQRIIDEICDDLLDEIDCGDDSDQTKNSLIQAQKNQAFLLRIKNRVIEQLSDPPSP